MEKTKLELEFLDEGNKKFVISLDNPKLDLSPEEVRAAMEAIIDFNIFDSSMNDLVLANDARIIRTSVDKLPI